MNTCINEPGCNSCDGACKLEGFIRNHYDYNGLIVWEEDKPNPHLLDKNASYHETDCPKHRQTECVITNLVTVYLVDKKIWPLIGVSACGEMAVWAD